MKTRTSQSKIMPQSKFDSEKQCQNDSVLLVYFNSFLENSGWNGLPNIYRAGSYFRKFIWLVLVLVTTGFMIFHVIEISEKYLEYPSTTQVEIPSEAKTDYPCVTICNINPVVYSHLEEAGNPGVPPPSEHLRALYFAIRSEKLAKPSMDGLTNQTINSGGNWSIPVYTDWETQYNGSDSFTNETEEYRAEENAYRQFADLDDQDKRKISTRFNDLIIDCSFAGIQCTSRNFSEFQSPYYGNCFTFNPGTPDMPSIKTVSRSGPKFGLEIKFFVQQDEYIPQLAKAAGIRVTIHNQSEFPFPSDNGFDVAPGFQTNIALRKLVISRLKTPYPSKCENLTKEQASAIDAFVQKYNVEYSTKGCVGTCYQKELVHRCNCTDPFYPMQGRAIGAESRWVESCGTFDEEECAEAVKTDYEAGRLVCDNCPQPCVEVGFETAVSQSLWPAQQYEPDVYQMYLERSPSFRRLLEREKEMPEIRDNAGKLKVYYRDLNFEKITEKAVYPSVFNFLAEVGGTIGLWTGLSVIGMVEVIELLIDIIRLAGIATCRKKGEKTAPR